MTENPNPVPEWVDGKKINEVLFCQQFLEKHPMKCVRGRLFTVDGLIEDEGQIGNLILEEISGVLTANLSKTVANLLASIKLQAYSPPLPIETDRIHVANGTYFMNGSFTADKSYCNNRLCHATFFATGSTPWLCRQRRLAHADQFQQSIHIQLPAGCLIQPFRIFCSQVAEIESQMPTATLQISVCTQASQTRHFPYILSNPSRYPPVQSG